MLVSRNAGSPAQARYFTFEYVSGRADDSQIGDALEPAVGLPPTLTLPHKGGGNDPALPFRPFPLDGGKPG